MIFGTSIAVSLIVFTFLNKSSISHFLGMSFLVTETVGLFSTTSSKSRASSVLNCSNIFSNSFANFSASSSSKCSLANCAMYLTSSLLIAIISSPFYLDFE